MPKEDYGLSPHDILCLDDKQLNEYVGLRRLNPYRADLTEYKAHPWKLKQLLSTVDYSTGKSINQSKLEREDKVTGIQHPGEETALAQRVPPADVLFLFVILPFRLIVRQIQM